MDAERWARVEELFHQVADLPPEERDTFLARACGDDEELRLELLSLLRGDATSGSLVDRNVAELAGAAIPPVASLPLPSHPFGPYRATRLLGEGGMGVVYLGERSDLGNVVAIKILRDAWLSPARRARFLTEQRTLAQLNHPGIAHLYDAGTLDDGTPWIAMEYVEGTAIHDFVRERHVSLAGRLRLVRAVCEGVLHAHQHLVVHRDIKPSNVLVRDDGTVKLLDFGIAKQLGGPGGGGDATRTGLRLMTPAYAAPEQLLGRPVSIRTDVYAIGALLYELLAGAPPFEDDDQTPGRLETRIVEEDPPRPSVRARRLQAGANQGARQGANQGATVGPQEGEARVWGVTASGAQWDDLDVLCLTAMHKDPARRYSSVDALLRDIDHFLAGEPLDAHPDSLGYRTATYLRRHRRATATTVAILFGAVALVTFYTVRLAQARDRALTESVRAQRIQRFVSNLFQGGDEASGPAESLRVVTLLDQGVAEARVLEREPAVQADLYQTLGSIYRQLGDLGRADSLLSTGVAQWKRVAGEGSADAARAAVALGDLRTDQARFDEAEALLRAALADLRRSRDLRDPSVTRAAVALGRALTERGDYAAAVATLDSTVAALRAGGDDSPELLEALGELANSHFYAGSYDVADSLNRGVLAMTRRLFGDRHPRVAEDLMNLGATEQERGNYPEAERYFRDALARTLAFHGEDHFRTAGNLVNLGRSLLLQNRLAEARQALERSLRIREGVYGPTHPVVANTLNELGSLAIRESRYDDAERIFGKVLEIYQASFPGRSHRTGVASGNLADTYLYREDYRRAEPLYREALLHYVATQGPEHLNTGIGYIKLGRCLLRSGRFREAVPETERGMAIVARIASPDVSFLQAARLDLSLAFDSLGSPERAAHFRAERERYLPKPAAR